jgi:hypothetical protein
MRTRVVRLWGLVAAGVSAGAVVIGVALAPHDGSRAEVRPTALHPPAPAVRALGVLQTWDRRWAAAWEAGHPGALAKLYVAGSGTGARDVGALSRWHDRGLRVTGLRQQVSAVAVLDRSPGRLVVRVTDRTIGGVVVGGRHRVGLPDSAWMRHRVVLRSRGGTWRVVEVRAQPAR